MQLISYLWLAGLLTVPWGVTQEAEPEPSPADQEPVTSQETAPAPAEPQTVTRQAESPEEDAAFDAMATEADQDLKISKATEFLHTFPDSSLAPIVHSDLAEIYRQRVDIDNFLKHGEEALKQAPDMVHLLATMSFYYAERKQPFKAAESAIKALAILGRLERPNRFTPSEWATQIFFLSGESHYALGRVQLGQAQRSNSTGPEDLPLQETVKHFRQTLEANPIHEFAAYRLAETYERQGDIENSVKMYARAAAIGGSISAYAQNRLDEIYQKTPELTPKAEVQAEQKQAIEKAQQERQQLLAQIEAESTPAEAPQVEITPVEITLPPTPPPPQPLQDEEGGK